MVCLKPCLAYPHSEIEAVFSTDRDEGDVRRTSLRDALHSFATSSGADALVDPQSDGSFGSLLAARRDATLGCTVLNCLFSSCFVQMTGTAKLLSPEEADVLCADERAHCIPVLGSNQLAQQLGESSQCGYVVVAIISSRIAGGHRDATLSVERVGEYRAKINIVSSGGLRKELYSGSMSVMLLDKLFAPSLDTASVPLSLIPMRENELPEYLKAALADFLERRVRLQVMCTAAMAAPTTRFVSLDRVYLRKTDNTAVRAYLHKSSSSCICGAHGKTFNGTGSVEINLETCGKELVKDHNGFKRCPIHTCAIDKSGNARLSVQGICTEGSNITVSCNHNDNAVFKRGVRVDNVPLNDTDRRELSTLLVSAGKFVGGAKKFFTNRKCVDAPGMLHHMNVLDEMFKTQMKFTEREHLEREDHSVQSTSAMRQRDTIAVDLLRARGVFRHVIKRGPRRSTPYLARAKSARNKTPLTPQELEIVDTHVHLFRNGD